MEARRAQGVKVTLSRFDRLAPVPQGLPGKSRNQQWKCQVAPEVIRPEAATTPEKLIVPPGPENPLGTRALRLGLPGYLIHGTNRPAGVGMRVTHGCIRMFPEDIEYLFGQIGIDTSVRIINEPVKIGWDGDRLVMEAHPVLEVATPVDEAAAGDEIEADTDDGDEVAVDEVDFVARDPLAYVIEQFVAATGVRPGELDWHLAEELVDRADGIPTEVGEAIKNAATGAALEID